MKLFCSYIVILFLALSCSNPAVKNKNEASLPIIGEKKLGANGDTIEHSVGAFRFINQFGDSISESIIDNKIFVADFFFATCQSICPVMSKRMGMVQEEFSTDPDFVILSHTVNPAHDSVSVLKEYGERYGAVKGKWHLLTGNKSVIYSLAKNSYLLNAVEEDGTPEGFLHSELFMLCDKKKRLRGIYDGTDSMQVIQLIADIKKLKSE